MNRKGWYVVSLLALLYVVSYIDRLVLALLIDPVKAELGISDTQIAFLIGPTFGFLYAAIGLPVAWLVDRGNRVRIAAIGVILWGLSTIGAGFADSFPTLLGLRMGVATGEAVLSPVAISLIADYFRREERGTPTAVFVCAGILGVMLAYAVGGGVVSLLERGALEGWPVVGALPTWRATLVLIGLPGIVLALLLLVTVRDPRRGQLDEPAIVTETSARPVGVFDSLANAVRFYTFFFIGNSMVMMITFAALAWYPTHLVRRFKVSIAESGYLFSVALGVAAAVLLLLPFIADRMAKRGRRGVLLPIELIVLPIGCLMFGLALVQDTLSRATLFTIAGVGLLSGINGLPSIIVGLTAAPSFRGRLMAISLASSNVIGLGVGPFLVAVMSDRLFTGPGALGTSLLTLTLTAGPLGWLLIFLSWRYFRAAIRTA